MYQYRQILYSQYFETQSGRRLAAGSSNLAASVEHDTWLLKQEILPLLPAVAQQPHIIDLGCGFGSWVYTLQQQGYSNVKGIDISPNQVAVAQSLGISGIEEAHLVPYLQEHRQLFEVVCGIDIIEHFGKDELVEVLTAVHAALQQNGMAVFRTPNADAPFSSVYANGDFTHETILNNSSAQQLLYSIGFKEVQVLPSCMNTRGWVKNGLRQICWKMIEFGMKTALFASGRSGKGIVFSPNLLIVARK